MQQHIVGQQTPATHYLPAANSSNSPTPPTITSCAGAFNIAHSSCTVAVPVLSSLHATTCAPNPSAPQLTIRSLQHPALLQHPHLFSYCTAVLTSSAGALAAHQHQPCAHAAPTDNRCCPPILIAACNNLCANQSQNSRCFNTLHTATAPVHCPHLLHCHPPKFKRPDSRRTFIQPSLFIQGRLVVLKNTILGSGEQSSSGEVLA
jgi:hypothetical protein